MLNARSDRIQTKHASGSRHARWEPLRADPQRVDVAAVGAKAHTLMVLHHLGFMVPNGVVLATSVERDFERDERSLDDVIAALPELPSERLMVRSSAVGEDGATSSFAGQLDSFQVDNDPDAVKVGVRQCWASAQSARAKSYQDSQGVALGGVAVIIQELVDPDYAGVYFTAHPSRPGRDLVEYVTGHCDQLVTGAVTPRSTSLPADNLPFDGDALRTAGNRVKAQLGADQDIEWLIKDQQLFLVQARPITAPLQTVTWSSTNLNENYPDPLSPLLYSIARRAYYHYFKSLSERLGVARTGEAGALFANIVGCWGERLYYNMSNVHAVISMSPLASSLAPAFDDFVGFQDADLRVRMARSHGPTAKATFIAKCFTNFLRLPKRVRRIERRVAAFVAREVRREDLSSLFHEFLELRFHRWVDASFADFYAMAWHGLLGRHLEQCGVSQPQGVQNTLLQAIPGLISTGPIESMWELRQCVLREGLRETVLNTSAPDLWHRLQVEESLTVVRRAIQVYLDAWGFRCAGELTFLSPNHAEDPVSFVRVLQSYLRTDDVSPKEVLTKMRAQQQQAMRAACDEIRANVGPVRSIGARLKLRALVRVAANAISARERVRLKQAQMYFKLKQVCQTFGDVLVAQTVLDRRDDVFFLEYDEISRLLNGDEVRGDYWRELVALRQTKRDAAQELSEDLRSVAFTYGRAPITPTSTLPTFDGLNGLPACGGKVCGRAVVLESLDEVSRLQRGDILVTRQTDPGWVCAFPLIAGLVVERGGMLSHGAIVAREFGVPAVVGVKGAVEEIEDGAWLEIDGDNGHVRVLTEPAAP